MKVVVLGATGMLGHTVADYMVEVYGEESVIRSTRSECSGRPNWISFDAASTAPYYMCRIPRDADYVINCIGVIKPFIEATGIVDTLQVNSIFPHRLAQYCNENNIRLIHITTDCVFSGMDPSDRGYWEDDLHTATDVYGRSKSLGEPISTAMVLRTSILGREIQKQASLVAWVQSQAGQMVNGYVNHFWNGITTTTYAECCRNIIDNDRWVQGLFHIFSPNSVTKCELVRMISRALNLHVDVVPVAADPWCDRCLGTHKDLCEQLHIPELSEQMKGL